MICSSIMQVRPPRAGRRTPRHPEEVGKRVSMGSGREDEGENERGPGEVNTSWLQGRSRSVGRHQLRNLHSSIPLSPYTQCPTPADT